MTTTTLSSREFDQDPLRAKEASELGPVLIVDEGRPTHVLLTIEAYRQLGGPGLSIADLLAMPGIEDIELEIPARRSLGRAADLS